MRTVLKYVIGLLLLIIYTIAIVIYLKKEDKAYVYILAPKIFSEFNGTKELMKKMQVLEQRQKTILDSISLEIQIAEKTRKDDKGLAVLQKKDQYNKLYNQFISSNREKMQEYEQGLWDQINQYVGEYGKNKKYSFILGAKGDGNIMFADSTLNKTDEVVKYINKKYAGE
jgi:outer membrane protein